MPGQKSMRILLRALGGLRAAVWAACGLRRCDAEWRWSGSRLGVALCCASHVLCSRPWHRRVVRLHHRALKAGILACVWWVCVGKDCSRMLRHPIFADDRGAALTRSSLALSDAGLDGQPGAHTAVCMAGRSHTPRRRRSPCPAPSQRSWRRCCAADYIPAAVLQRAWRRCSDEPGMHVCRRRLRREWRRLALELAGA